MEINNQHPIAEQRKFFYGIGTNIIREGIFERFPELIPCVGMNYERTDGKHKKMLLVGESNYFDKSLESVSVFQEAERWYKEDTDKLIPEEMRVAVSNDIGYKTFNRVFDIAREVLNDNGVESVGDRLDETAFYNYYLRPALNPGPGVAKKIKPESIDKEVAGVALCGIIERLQPQLIVFFSKPAYDDFNWYIEYNGLKTKYDAIKIDRVSHPSSAWWNRNNGEKGRALLKKILKEYWLQ